MINDIRKVQFVRGLIFESLQSQSVSVGPKIHFLTVSLLWVSHTGSKRGRAQMETSDVTSHHQNSTPFGSESYDIWWAAWSVSVKSRTIHLQYYDEAEFDFNFVTKLGFFFCWERQKLRQKAKILRAVKDLSINLSVSPAFWFCAEVAHLYRGFYHLKLKSVTVPECLFVSRPLLVYMWKHVYEVYLLD